MTYGIFAYVYDELMDDSLFEKWQDYVIKNLPETKTSILELGCGNGKLGILLKKSGYDIKGLDLSEEMLSLAQQNQEEAGITFPLLHGDMRDLSDLGEHEAIISFCDTLCYLPTPEDLQTVFHQAHKHLKKGGVLLFDVFTTEYIAQLDGYAYHDELPGLVFMWDSYHGMHEHSVEHELSFLREVEDDLYKREVELHQERTYPLEFYVEALEKAGFSNIEILADFDKEVTGDNVRWFFKAQK